MEERGDVKVLQRSRYPRCPKSFQSANSSQKAKRPSSAKRKTSRSPSYRNSEPPLSLRYVSISHRSSARRLFARFGRCSADLLASWFTVHPSGEKPPHSQSLCQFYGIFGEQKYIGCSEGPNTIAKVAR